ncbi:MAG: 3-keto-5-aminohexanoate cleavage protein [Limibacillus sp.]
MSFEEPLILTVAPNGARKTKNDHPALPIAPAELAAEAEACRNAGAAMIHLHVRDDKEGHSLDAGRYGEAIDAIRERVGDGIIIQMTTEAVGIYTPEEQMAAVRAVEPEAASLAVRELFSDPALEQEASRFCHELAERGCMAQYIVYSDEDLANFDRLVERGLLPRGEHFMLFVLGRYTAGQKSDPTDLLPFVNRNIKGHRWAVCAFGAKEAACGGAALCLGGHVRVGFENNLLLGDGSQAPRNAALVGQATAAAKAVGRPLANAIKARAILRGEG